MNDLIGSGNSITYAQFTLRGGWKAVAGGPLGISLVVGGFVIVYARIDSQSGALSGISSWMTHALLAIQAANILLFGAARVSAGIRFDISSGIIESHRLMPISPGRAIAGYLVGGPCLAIGFSISNLLLGLVFGSLGGIDAPRWLLANAILFTFGALTWTLTASLAVVMKGAYGFIFAALLAAGMSQLGLIYLSHGGTVLTASILNRHFFQMYPDLTRGQLVSLTSQALLAAACFVAAARKFKRRDRPALGVWLGLAIASIWTAMCVIGRIDDRAFERIRTELSAPPESARSVADVAIGLILALPALSNATRASSSTRWRAGEMNNALRVPSIVVMLATCALVVAPVVFAPSPKTRDDLTGQPGLSMLAASLGMFIVTIWLTMKWRYRSRASAADACIVWMFISCVALPIADFVYNVIRSFRTISTAFDFKFEPTWLSSASPVGLAIQAWNEWSSREQIFTGLAVQVGMMLVPATLYLLGRRKRGLANLRG